jgi:hypothetical protein
MCDVAIVTFRTVWRRARVRLSQQSTTIEGEMHALLGVSVLPDPQAETTDGEHRIPSEVSVPVSEEGQRGGAAEGLVMMLHKRHKHVCTSMKQLHDMIDVCCAMTVM